MKFKMKIIQILSKFQYWLLQVMLLYICHIFVILNIKRLQNLKFMNKIDDFYKIMEYNVYMKKKCSYTL